MNYNYDIVKPLLYKSRNKNPIIAADDMLNNNIFALPPFGKISIDIDNDFKIVDKSRSIWRLIHGLTFLGDLFDAYLSSKNLKYIKYAEETLYKWFEYKEKHTDDKMIFHDETTALRLTYWLNFHYLCGDVISNDLNRKLGIEIEETVKLLCTEKFHSKNTNHGMFQDISLLAYSIMYFEHPFESKVYQLALKRLKEYFYSTFTNDGVHKEHSPDYHYMVTSNVKKIVNVVSNLHGESLSNDEQKLISIYTNAEKYAMHILQPNLFLPKISDCNNFLLTKRNTYLKLFSSEEFTYVKTEGQEGEEPNQKQILFKDAGYFISRSNWSRKATYFLFLASYNARYHKHSDDLSFILYDGEDLFIDSGPNGYDYDSPLTKYAYSSFAHSSLIVNSKSLPRNDDHFDKVGILDAKYKEEGQEFEVTGYNYRYPSVRHQRKITGNHTTKSYNITDYIKSDDRNEYQILYQLSNKMTARISGNIISIYSKISMEKKAEIVLDIDSSIKHYEIELLNGEENNQYSYEFPKMGSNVESLTVSVKFYSEVENTIFNSKIELRNFIINKNVEVEDKSYGISNINYKFYQSVEPSDSLLVIFSSSTDNYDALKDIPINRLYLDNGTDLYNNYYLGTNKKNNYEADVLSLIMNMMTKYSIQFHNITLIGSSYAGFASLYYGIKYGFKNVISGSPHTKLGDYLIDESHNLIISNLLSGGSDIGDKYYLNNILYNIKPVERDFSHYFLCSVEEDYYYKKHIYPYLNYLGKYDISLNYKSFPNNQKFEMNFLDYIYESLNLIYNLKLERKRRISNLEINSHEIDNLNASQTLIKLNIIGRNYDLVYYLLDSKNEVIYRSNPQKSNEIVFENSKIINKRIKFFLRSPNKVEKYITPVIRNLENIVINSIK